MRLTFTLYLLLTTIFVIAQDSTLQVPELMKLDLEDLLNLKVVGPGAITSISYDESPAASTVITSADIQNTPHRNIYDLLESYVPGAIWMGHEDGPHMGVRGVIVNRNYKYLLLLDGRNINNKGHFGAKSELEMWDLNDIERIEIIRGPGSVTYGAGAVGGVINIITKRVKEPKKLKVGLQYLQPFSSNMFYADFGIQKNKIKLSVYNSITRTSGYSPDHVLVSKDFNKGNVGKDVFIDKRPLTYYSDYRDIPQIKSNVNLQIGKNLEFISRYTQQGSHWRGNEVQSVFSNQRLDQQGTQDRQYLAILRYKLNINDKLSLLNSLSFDSYDTERTSQSKRDTTNPFHPLNKRVNFSESEILLKSILNYKPIKWFESALGFEYSCDNYGAGWGEGSNTMRLGEEGSIVSDSNSLAFLPGNEESADRNGRQVFVGNGWEVHTFSIYSEFNIKIKKRARLISSYRLDKNTFSSSLSSARLAFIYPYSTKNISKAIIQRSARMNTGGQMLFDHRNNQTSQPERLSGIELSHIYMPISKWRFNANLFFNVIEVLAYNGDLNQTRLIGSQGITGLELETYYKGNSSQIGASFTYTQQVSWDLEDEFDGAGMSYSEYRREVEISDDELVVMNGVGNNINNWPTFSVKSFWDYSLNKKLGFRINGQLYWGHYGAKDGLTSLKNASQGTSSEEELLSLLESFDKDGVYAYDFRKTLFQIGGT